MEFTIALSNVSSSSVNYGNNRLSLFFLYKTSGNQVTVNLFECNSMEWSKGHKKWVTFFFSYIFESQANWTYIYLFSLSQKLDLCLTFSCFRTTRTYFYFFLLSGKLDRSLPFFEFCTNQTYVQLYLTPENWTYIYLFESRVNWTYVQLFF